jgi:hypothetical protein
MITLGLQYAHEEDKVEERGEVSLHEAIEAFRTFPWQQQLAEANRLQICNPTLFLRNTEDGSLFFASLMLKPEIDFQLYFETEEETEERAFLGKRKVKEWVAYDLTGHKPKEVEAAIQAFCDSDKEKLKDIIGSKKSA